MVHYEAFEETSRNSHFKKVAGVFMKMAGKTRMAFPVFSALEHSSPKRNELCLIKHVLIGLKETKTLIIQKLLERVLGFFTR